MLVALNDTVRLWFLLMISDEYLKATCELAVSCWARMPFPPSDVNASIREPIVKESLGILSLKWRRPFEISTVTKVPHARMIAIACMTAGSSDMELDTRLSALSLINLMAQASRWAAASSQITAMLNNKFFKISAEVMREGCPTRNPERIPGVERHDAYDEIILLWQNSISVVGDAASSALAIEMVKYGIISLFGEWSLKALDSQLEAGQFLIADFNVTTADGSRLLAVVVAIPILFTRLQATSDKNYYVRAQSQVEKFRDRLELIPSASEELILVWRELSENVEAQNFDYLENHVKTPDSETNRTCAVCWATTYSLGSGLMNCSRCLSRVYCSRGCQKM